MQTMPASCCDRDMATAGLWQGYAEVLLVNAGPYEALLGLCQGYIRTRTILKMCSSYGRAVAEGNPGHERAMKGL